MASRLEVQLWHSASFPYSSQEAGTLFWGGDPKATYWSSLRSPRAPLPKTGATRLMNNYNCNPKSKHFTVTMFRVPETLCLPFHLFIDSKYRLTISWGNLAIAREIWSFFNLIKYLPKTKHHNEETQNDISNIRLFPPALPKIKSLGINLTKYIQDLKS